jgi:hypothetical protein
VSLLAARSTASNGWTILLSSLFVGDNYPIVGDEVVKHTQAKRGFVLLPRRSVVERSFAWATCSPISSAYWPKVNNRLWAAQLPAGPPILTAISYPIVFSAWSG